MNERHAPQTALHATLRLRLTNERHGHTNLCIQYNAEIANMKATQVVVEANRDAVHRVNFSKPLTAIPASPSLGQPSTRIFSHIMITLQRAFIFLLLLSVITAVIAAPNELDRKQLKHYAASKRFIRTTYGIGEQFEPIEHLAHLRPAHPGLEEDAWQHARVAGNGPIHWTMDGAEKNFFATTRIASNSRLVRGGISTGESGLGTRMRSGISGGEEGDSCLSGRVAEGWRDGSS